MSEQPPATFGPRQAMPVDASIAEAGATGWDWFAETVGGAGARPTYSAELEAEAKRIALDAAVVFGTQEGARVLEWLLDLTLRRPVWTLNLGAEALTYAAMREGQNGIVFTVLKLIAEGRREAAPYREGA